MAARDLRSAEPQKMIASGISEDIMSAMTMSQLLDYISVRVNGEKAVGQDFQINLFLSDTGDQALLQVKNNVLVYYVDVSSSIADATVRMPRKTLEQLALDPSVTPASVTTTGDSAVFDTFVGMLDVFDNSFNIVLP